MAINQFTSMAEFTALLLSLAGSVTVTAAYAAASALRIAPQRTLAPLAIGAFAAQTLFAQFAATGVFTPSNRRSAAAMEAWQRRLDVFVRTGADGSGGEGLLLTPLAVITGASSGLGEKSAENLAACGWKVVLACRDLVAAERAKASIIANAQRRLQQRYRGISDEAQRQRVAQLIAAVATNVTVSALDVSDYDSIRAFAEEAVSIEATAGQPTEVPNGLGLRTRHDGLRLLMNNAGIFQHCYGKWALNGVEGMFNVNYAGPAYLTFLITRDIVTPRVQRQQSAGGDVVPFRTVNLGSCANLWAFGSFAPPKMASPEEASAALKTFATALLSDVSDPSQNPKNNTRLWTAGGDTYGLSKLGMIVLAANCAAKAKAEGLGAHVTAFSLHPGGVTTRITRYMRYRSMKAALFSRWLFSVGFRHVSYGASNQTYLSLALIDEQRTTDPLTRSVVSAAFTGKKSSFLCRSSIAPFGSTVVAAEASGKFLVDGGEAVGKAAGLGVRPSVFEAFDEWTEAFIKNTEADIGKA